MTTRPYPKISEDLRSRPKSSEDVGNSSEVLKKMIMLHTSPVSFLQKWEILGNYRHLSNEEWSSQLWSQFLQLRKEAWKKFRTSTGLEPVTSRYRCDALPTELWSHWRWEQVNFGFICSRERYVGDWCIWNKSYVNCGYEIKWRIQMKKIQDFNGAWSPEFFSGFFTQLQKLRS